MLFRLLLLFTIVPLVELALLLNLAKVVGWQYTVALVLATGVLGAWLARWQGLQCWRRLHQQLAAGQLPADSLLDGLMILLAGVLLVTPGVLTDAVGFTLLLPPFRALFRRRLKDRMGAQIHFGPPPPGAGQVPPNWPPGAKRPPQSDTIVETRVIDVAGKRVDKDKADSNHEDHEANEA